MLIHNRGVSSPFRFQPICFKATNGRARHTKEVRPGYISCAQIASRQCLAGSRSSCMPLFIWSRDAFDSRLVWHLRTQAVLDGAVARSPWAVAPPEDLGTAVGFFSEVAHPDQLLGPRHCHRCLWGEKMLSHLWWAKRKGKMPRGPWAKLEPLVLMAAVPRGESSDSIDDFISHQSDPDGSQHPGSPIQVSSDDDHRTSRPDTLPGFKCRQVS